MLQLIKNPFWSGSLLLFLVALLFPSGAEPGQLTLNWADNSGNESGFKIERKLGANGTYAQVATVGINTTSYVDTGLTNGSTYCYHVRSYNSAGNSLFTNESCGVVPSSPSGSFTFSVIKAGTGSGTVSSNPAGINCGSACSANFSNGTSVTLTAVAGSSSVFSGWSGGGCSGTGTCTVTVNASIQVTATFAQQTAGTFTLTTIKSGTGIGPVSSNPAGINCGTACSTSFSSGTSVVLTASGGEGSVFTGWSGGGCSGTGKCTITLSANTTVTATFSKNAGTTQNFTLTTAISGTGSGTVTSNPTGINCTNTCSTAFTSGTPIALTATAATGSVFSGWSGGGCSGIGICTVTLSANVTVTATFSPKPTATETFTLSVSKSGNGNGTITSNPAGINCGSTCSASFAARTRIALSATPDANSAFDRWSDGCNGTTRTCTIKLGGNTQVVAYFKPKTTGLTVRKMGPGSGTVTSTELGISCGAKCSESYSGITAGTISAKAAPGSSFAGWTGGNCQSGSTCAVLVSSDTTIAATFVKNPSFHISVFRASNSQWFFDLNGNGVWEDCSVDLCLGPFGKKGSLPVAGDWDGSGLAKIGVFNPSSGTWQLDLNGNGVWEDCSVDLCLGPFGKKGSLPVAGDWDGSGLAKIGVFNPSSGTWQLDLNGNGILEDCSVDLCLGPFGKKGSLPVAGDWDGSGISRIGVFNPSSGTWQLDLNGNGILEDCSVDLCLGPFGKKGSLPVAGDWDGSGVSRIGVFNPSSGTWQLDLNGNGIWDGCEVDLCLGGFGKDGDLPVIGGR